ncbi:hypothetical protein ART_1308 [Arthrobacter sp. PAMC 25486]|nr:hypothetical protein ART_1308 [Arthrobacter sp. PAMC 25486]
MLAGLFGLRSGLIFDALGLELLIVGHVAQGFLGFAGCFLSFVADLISESHGDLLQFESN